MAPRLGHTRLHKPHMDGFAPPGDGVADTIGTFTTSIRVAQDMFLVGLPRWLIWSSSTFGDEKIFRIVEIFHAKDYVIFEPHKFNYPVIFKGPATSQEKYRAIELYVHNFLYTQDPFAMSCASPPAGASQPSTSSTPAVASSSATQHLTGQNFQGAVRRPVRGRGAGKLCRLIDILICYYFKRFTSISW